VRHATQIRSVSPIGHGGCKQTFARRNSIDRPRAVVDPTARQSTIQRVLPSALNHLERFAMRFLCLVYQDEKKLAALSQLETDSLVAACIKWVAELEKAGHHILSAGLQCVRAAATVRSREGKVTTTDGPFAETKEFLGGFTLINARDLAEALK